MKSNLELVPQIPRNLDISNLRNFQYGILQAGSEQSYKQTISTSFSNSQISATIIPACSGCYTNRRMLVNVKFKLTFVGQSGGPGQTLLNCAGLQTAPGVNPGLGSFDSPRCLPLSECFKTFSIQVNNDSINTNLNSYSRIMQRFARGFDEEDKDLSYSPSMPDQHFSYDVLQGFPRNPMGAYGDNVSQCPRGGFTKCTILRNDSSGLPGDIAEVELDVTEPAWISPWNYGRNMEEVSFLQIQQIIVNITLGSRGNSPFGLVASLWSHAASSPSTLTSANADVQFAQILMNYVTPDQTQRMPQQLNYSYSQPTLYQTSYNTPVAAGATTMLQMNALQLAVVPNAMIFWVDQRDSDTTITTTNSYFSITNANITYNNRDGVLSNASQQDLYNIYLANGGNMSFPQWTTYVGSILRLQMGIDIPLDVLSAPGLRAVQNVSIQLTVKNISDFVQIPKLNCLVMDEGVYRITDQQISRSVGVLDHEDVLQMKSMTPISWNPPRNFSGAGFWSDAANFLKKLVRPAITAAQSLVPQQYQPLVSIADTAAKSYGLGLGSRRGQGMVGGALVSRDELQKLAY